MRMNSSPHPAVPADSLLYTPAFILLCISHALFAASFNMMIPELPAYLTSLGGAEHKGLIIALFTITAGISRPFSGKLADTIGRMPVMYIGVIACVVCGVLYPALAFVSGFLWLRFFPVLFPHILLSTLSKQKPFDSLQRSL